MKAFAGLAAVVLLALGAAACGDGGSAAVAKVGSQPITKKQLDAVLLYDRGQYRKMHFTFPRPGSAEYVLLRQQAVDFLVEQSRAHQADATIGVKPSNQVVSDAAFRKVTAKVHVTDADVRSSFRTHPTGRPLDRATASDIRRLLLKQRRATIMHGFVGAARRDYPVTYEPGYRPVAAWTLAKRIWTVHVVSKVCDLPPGMHPYLQAVAHSCASQTGPFIVSGEKPCPLIDQPGGLNGFTSAMEDDGFADYATSNAGTCAGGPRGITVDITAQENRTPVMVSYLPGRGSTRLVDSNFGVTLNHPRRLHVLRVDKIGQGAEGIEIANFALSALSTGRTLPPNGIDVSLLVPYGGTGAFKGPNPHDSIFPLSLARCRPLVGKSTMFGVQADGASYTVTIREGARPSTADQAAVQEIITSIRFQPARHVHQRLLRARACRSLPTRLRGPGRRRNRAAVVAPGTRAALRPLLPRAHAGRILDRHLAEQRPSRLQGLRSPVRPEPAAVHLPEWRSLGSAGPRRQEPGPCRPSGRPIAAQRSGGLVRRLRARSAAARALIAASPVRASKSPPGAPIERGSHLPHPEDARRAATSGPS